MATDTSSDDYDKKTTRQRRLSFGIPETPAVSTDDQATQIATLLRTVAELERTSLRTQAENELLRGRQDAADPQNDDAPAEDSPTGAAMSELTEKLNILTTVVAALADKQHHPAPKAKQTRTAGGSGLNSEDRTKLKTRRTRTAGGSGSDSESDIMSDSESDSDSDSDSDHKTTTARETGPACISTFCRAIDYATTDPDRISDRHDVDGVDSDFKRISDKRPLLLSDLSDAKEKGGSQLREVASRLLKRLSSGLKPQPSPQCTIGLAIFAIHDRLSETVQCRLQSAIMAARHCFTP